MCPAWVAIGIGIEIGVGVGEGEGVAIGVVVGIGIKTPRQGNCVCCAEQVLAWPEVSPDAAEAAHAQQEQQLQVQ